MMQLDGFTGCTGQDKEAHWEYLPFTYVTTVWRRTSQLSQERHHTNSQQQHPSAHAQ